MPITVIHFYVDAVSSKYFEIMLELQVVLPYPDTITNHMLADVWTGAAVKSFLPEVGKYGNLFSGTA